MDNLLWANAHFAHNKTKEEANMTTNEYAMSILQVRKEDTVPNYDGSNWVDSDFNKLIASDFKINLQQKWKSRLPSGKQT